jgi:hypothetical protein
MQVEVIANDSHRTDAGAEFGASDRANTWRGWRSVLGHTHTYSGRDDHGGPVQPPESYARLARWADQCGADAVGMGSPYTPKSAATYGRFDEGERDVYYRPDFDKLSVLDTDEIESMLSDANRAGGGRTLFYLDNETPKGRYGHMWWLGYHYDFPAWHDYDQPYDRWMLEQSNPGDCGDEPVAYERRPYLQILATQRSRGALGFWAHPTSWWRGDRGQFITNIASEMPAHAIAEGSVDGMVIMGYHPHRPQYQALWFELLDRGYRVPAVAEMDCGLSDPNAWAKESALLTYAEAGAGPLTLRRLVDAFRCGRMFVSSGPLLTLSVDGHAMGDVAPTSRDQTHRVAIDARPAPGQDVLGRVELLGRGGRVLWRRDEWRGGRVELSMPGLAERGYLVARAFGPESTGAKWREVRRTAVSNPVYLHPRGESFNQPATTRVHVMIRPDSPFAGGEVRFESIDGTLLGSATPARGSLKETLPASGRVTLVSTDGRSHTHYLVNANPALQAAQRYLYRGRFLLDFPNLQPGEVPPEAWRIDRFADAMRELRLTY